MKFSRLLILLMLSAALAACQSSNIREGVEPSAVMASEKALIIGSVSQNVDTDTAIVADFRINHTSDLETLILYSRDISFFFRTTASRFGFVDGRNGGRIFAIEVEPGTHQLDYWSVSHTGSGMKLRPKVPPPTLEFSLAAGDIVYLGNLHINIPSAETSSGVQIPIGGTASINDLFERDMQKFRLDYPEFSERSVRREVLFSGYWEHPILREETLEIPEPE